MNPLITKAIEECLPKEKEIDFGAFELLEYQGYNICLQEIIDDSLPLIFKMIQEEIEKLPKEYFENRCWIRIDFIRNLLSLLTIEKK